MPEEEQPIEKKAPPQITQKSWVRDEKTKKKKPRKKDGEA